MENSITLGLPRMHVEFGEKRDFLPDFVARLEKLGAQIFLEYGYGVALGFTEADYHAIAPKAIFTSHQEVYQQENVLVLRCPLDKDLRLLKPGACIISMMHYSTRPARVELLHALNVQAISLDSIKDDVGRRMVENLHSVAWNGLEVAFRVLQRNYPAP
ncbi:MAG TPA: alanine dehydrogenase, partial [Anaerolineae bacterium]|nr:alanine dehydrogenase [Anaerolineae bacterium]